MLFFHTQKWWAKSFAVWVEILIWCLSSWNAPNTMRVMTWEKWKVLHLTYMENTYIYYTCICSWYFSEFWGCVASNNGKRPTTGEEKAWKGKEKTQQPVLVKFGTQRAIFYLPLVGLFPVPPSSGSQLPAEGWWCWSNTEACWLSLDCKISMPTSEKTTKSASSSRGAAGNIHRLHRESLSPILSYWLNLRGIGSVRNCIYHFSAWQRITNSWKN